MTESILSPRRFLIANALADSSYQVADAAKALLVKASAVPSLQTELFSDNFVAHLLALKGSNLDILTFRIQELVIDYLKANPANEQFIVNSNLRHEFMFRCVSGDFLRDLNLIETYSQMVIKAPIAFEFLDALQVWSSLMNYLTNNKGSTEYSLMATGILKLIGVISLEKPKYIRFLSERHGLLSAIQSLLDEDDKAVEKTAIIVLGNIGSFADGFSFLVSEEHLLAKFIDVCLNITGEFKLECMRTWSCIFGAMPEETENIEQFESTMSNVYDKIKINGYNLLSTCLSMGKSAFDDERIVCYAILKSMCMHPWGLQKVLGKTDVVGFLMDRSREFSKLGKEWRFSIYQTIVKYGPIYHVEHPIIPVFTKYIKEGPFASQGEAAVAFQSA